MPDGSQRLFRGAPVMILLISAMVGRCLAEQPAVSASDPLWRASAGVAVPAAGPVGVQTPNAACQKVPRPVWTTEYRDEVYTVTRPLIETSTREVRQVRYEPVTTFVPRQVDQGAWVEQQVVRPGRTTMHLRWIEGGWTIDPASGREYWRLPMLRPVRVRQPDQTTTVRAWKPNVVTLSVPKISYQPRDHIQQVPVQTVRYVEERRVRRVPVHSRRLAPEIISPSGATSPTFVTPPADQLPQAIDPSALPPTASPPADVPAPIGT